MAIFKRLNRLTPNPSIFNSTTDGDVTLPLGDNIYANLSQFSPKGSETDYFDESLTQEDQRVMKVINKLEEPFQNSNGSWVRRSEHHTRNDLLKEREIYWSESFWVPSRIEGGIEKNILGGINMQWHSGSSIYSSPYFTISFEDERIRIKTRWNNSGFSTNYMWFDIGPATRGQWHHFEIFQYLSDDINLGRMTVFHNRELAKIYNPITFSEWTVPTSSTSGISDLYIAYPAKGTLPAVSGGVSLLDWFGKTFYPLESLSNYWKSGFYRSGSMNLYYDSGGNPVNTTDPEGDWYIEPGSYKEIWFKNVKFANKEGSQTYQDVYEGLNINGEAPIIPSGTLTWFTFSHEITGNLLLPEITSDASLTSDASGFLISGDLAIPEISSEAVIEFDVPVYEFSGDLEIPQITSEAVLTNGEPNFILSGNLEIPEITSEAVIETEVPVYEINGNLLIPQITSEASLTREVPIYEITGNLLLPEITSESFLTNGDPANNIVGDLMIPEITSEAVLENVVPVYSMSGNLLLPQLTSTASLSTAEDLIWRVPGRGNSRKKNKLK